jgi:hypothetical protein
MSNQYSSVAVVLFMAIAMVVCPDAAAVRVAVRFPEGITHGFLQVRSTAGDIIGQGEMTQMLDPGRRGAGFRAVRRTVATYGADPEHRADESPAAQ